MYKLYKISVFTVVVVAKSIALCLIHWKLQQYIGVKVTLNFDDYDHFHLKKSDEKKFPFCYNIWREKKK